MPIRTVILLLSTALLGACSVLPKVEAPPSKTETRAPANALDFSDYASTSNVQVYSLDKPIGPEQAPGAYLPTDQYAGTVSRSDANVTVYALDSSGVPAGGLPSLMSKASGPYPSPFPAEDRYATSWPNPPEIEAKGVTVSPLFTPTAMAPVPAATPLVVGSRIFFDHDSDTLDASDRKLLLQIAERYSAMPGMINIIGHASPRATAPNAKVKDVVNLKVSLDRAFEVSRFLILHGVPANAIRTIGRGDADPGVMIPGLDGEEASRRVEIHLSGN